MDDHYLTSEELEERRSEREWQLDQIVLHRVELPAGERSQLRATARRLPPAQFRLLAQLWLIRRETYDPYAFLDTSYATLQDGMRASHRHSQDDALNRNAIAAADAALEELGWVERQRSTYQIEKGRPERAVQYERRLNLPDFKGKPHSPVAREIAEAFLEAVRPTPSEWAVFAPLCYSGVPSDREDELRVEVSPAQAELLTGVDRRTIEDILSRRLSPEHGVISFEATGRGRARRYHAVFGMPTIVLKRQETEKSAPIVIEGMAAAGIEEGPAGDEAKVPEEQEPVQDDDKIAMPAQRAPEAGEAMSADAEDAADAADAAEVADEPAGETIEAADGAAVMDDAAYLADGGPRSPEEEANAHELDEPFDADIPRPPIVAAFGPGARELSSHPVEPEAERPADPETPHELDEPFDADTPRPPIVVATGPGARIKNKRPYEPALEEVFGSAPEADGRGADEPQGRAGRDERGADDAPFDISDEDALALLDDLDDDDLTPPDDVFDQLASA